MDENKYIIYKGTGGLFHNLAGLTDAIRTAKDSNRILINDCFSHIRINYKYKLNFEDYFVINDNTFIHYNNYDSVPKDIMFNEYCLDEIINISPNKMIKFDYLYNDYNLSIINNDQKIIVYAKHGSIVDPNIKVNPYIFNKLNLEEKINEKYLSIHYRNTDMKHDINRFIIRARLVFNKTNIKILYLASDDNSAFNIFKSNFPDIKIIRKTIPDNTKKGGLHYISEDKDKQMYECLRDVYYILHSYIFIPSPYSAFSKNIMYMVCSKDSIFPNLKCSPLLLQ